MNFKEWIENFYLEMPLSHFGYRFHQHDDSEEFFDKNKLQVTTPFTNDEPSVAGIEKGKFTRRDQILISRPKTFRELEERLKNSKYNFNILMIEKNPDYSYSKSSEINQLAPPYGLGGNHSEIIEYLKENKIDFYNSITFIQRSSSGHLLTPWMILHRIGHAITTRIGNKNVDYKFYSIVREYLPEKFNNKILSIFEFKSAKDPKYSGINDAELIHEVIAEYLWNGKIRLSTSLGEQDKKECEQLIDELEKLVDELLKECVGKIISP